MTAINLALRNLYGYVLWGNSLSGEVKLAYRSGMNVAGGFIRHAHPGELARTFPPPAPPDANSPVTTVTLPAALADRPGKQLLLF